MWTLILEPAFLLGELYVEMLDPAECAVTRSVQEAEEFVAKHGLPAVLITERHIARFGELGWNPDWQSDGPFDGDVFAAKLVEREQDLPVVFVLGAGGAGLRQRRHQAVLYKPFTPSALRDAVRAATAGETVSADKPDP